MPVALIADVADSFNPFIVNEFRDLFDEPRLVYLIRDLRHNNDIPFLSLTFY